MKTDTPVRSLSKEELIEILHGYELIFLTQKTIERVHGYVDPIDDKVYEIYEKYKARLEAILEGEKKTAK